MGDDAEAGLVGLIRAKDFDHAATEALERYGPELYGFLVNVLGGEADATEVFLQLGEDLWNGLPAFGFRASVRTWLYVLARHAAARYRRTPWNRGARRGDSRLDELVARTRSRTAPWLRTDVKDRLRTLRDSLDPEDREILVLRVDRGLSWEEVARVTLGSESPEEALLERETARVSKRYQLIKDELRQRAGAAGLLGDKS
jgi:RNA polymerase sigma-70 factor (ECF subfamily)